MKLLSRKRGRDIKIETTDAEKLAVKLPEIAAENYDGPLTDLKKLE
jgi:hypothetical protein